MVTRKTVLLCIGIISIFCVQMPVLAQLEQTEQFVALTPFEKTIKIRCDAMYRVDKPHVVWLFGMYNQNWFNLPGRKELFAKCRIGYAILFHGFYVGNETRGTGIGPIDGRLTYRDKEETEQFIRDLRAMGVGILGYVAPSRWVNAGLTGTDLIEEVKRHNWDGVYFDGWEFRTHHETVDTLTRLKNRGYKIYIHDSIQPHLGSIESGRVSYSVPGVEMADWVLWGETNKSPSTLLELIPLFKSRVSRVDRIPHVLPSYKPSIGSWLEGVNKNEMRLKILPHLLTVEAHFGLGVSIANMSKWYIPAYEVERAKYLADPDEYVRKVASSW